MHWLVDFVAEHLAEAGARSYLGPAAMLLESVAELVCRQQQTYGFPADRLPPACSIAVAVDRGDTYEITRIGDTTAVMVTGERVTVLATDFFETAGDIESVFSGHPRGRLRPHHRRRLDRCGPDLLCTDGFARLVSDYTLLPHWRHRRW